ncbi:flagellar hook-length control protein FliK [Stenotrophomonas sp. Iso1]|uniref:flagellar hook-length control protein FliK n=1 Tax=Stenotrophomonas sp. Iso1 TaxID=2977283 RepID=UPI0022B7A5FB|nr:flagellar hook-length control protein FliK [Stenotrophomonas sp. Iso1]
MNVLTSGLSVGGNVETGSPPRTNGSTGSTGSKSKSGFDALLQEKPATQKSEATSPAVQDSKPSQSSSASDEASHSEGEDAASMPPASTEDSNSNTAEQTDEAPWPPLGLSAMLMPAPEPSPTPTVTSPVAQGEARPGANSALPAGATPLPATLAIPAAQASAAESAEPIPAALTAAIAQGADDMAGSTLDSAESPVPTTFNALLQNPALLDVRPTAPGSSVQAPTATPDINSGDFDETFSARVGWMADQKIGHAHIRITPHDLGLVEVKLQLDGDRVHASFTSAHADVRHALESSLPRLREMLGEQGLQLAQADVGQQPTSQQQGSDGHAAAGGSFTDGQDSGVDMPAPTSQTLRMRGLLDAYA